MLNAKQEISSSLFGYANIRFSKEPFLSLQSFQNSIDVISGIFEIQIPKKFYEFFLVSRLCEELSLFLEIFIIVMVLWLQMDSEKICFAFLSQVIHKISEVEATCGKQSFENNKNLSLLKYSKNSYFCMIWAWVCQGG